MVNYCVCFVCCAPSIVEHQRQHRRQNSNRQRKWYFLLFGCLVVVAAVVVAVLLKMEIIIIKKKLSIKIQFSIYDACADAKGTRRVVLAYTSTHTGTKPSEVTSTRTHKWQNDIECAVAHETYSYINSTLAVALCGDMIILWVAINEFWGESHFNKCN